MTTRIKPFQIRADWRALESACNKVGSSSAGSWLYEALAEATKGEREHRAFGRRLVGNIGRMMSIQDAAMGVVLSHVYKPHKRPKSFAEVASYRHDVALAYAIRDELERCKVYPWSKRNRPQAEAFDYAVDVAGHERMVAA